MNSKAIIAVAVIVGLIIGMGLGAGVFPRVETVTSTVTKSLTQSVTTTSVITSSIKVIESKTITITRTLTETPETVTITKTLPPTTVTVTSIVTSEETTETHTTPSEKGTYESPASVGEPVTVEYYDKVLEVTVLNFVRGSTANMEIKKANIFNPEPKEGYEYLLVEVKVAYISGDESQLVSPANFKAYVKGAGYSNAWVVLPDNRPKLEMANLLPGGEVKGWIAFEVPKNEEVLIGFELGFEPLCFIKIE